MVAWHVTMFKKIKFHTHENVGWGPVNLPEQQMHTAATWIVLPDPVCARFDRETLDGALIGLARLARNTAPLLLMCDARDLGVQAQAQAPFTGKPTLYLYDSVPGGVGLSERIHDLWSDLLAVCRDLVRDCPCLEGCPGCVGPPAEVGIRGKAAATELLESLVAGARP
jgi:DEAD/DEAH box helicase domain-containing protein